MNDENIAQLIIELDKIAPLVPPGNKFTSEWIEDEYSGVTTAINESSRGGKPYYFFTGVREPICGFLQKQSRGRIDTCMAKIDAPQVVNSPLCCCVNKLFTIRTIHDFTNKLIVNISPRRSINLFHWSESLKLIIVNDLL